MAIINRSVLNWSRTIHVYLSIALLVVLIFFSITGITLNNVDLFSPSPKVSSLTLQTLPDLPRDNENRIIQSIELKSFVRQEFGVKLEYATVAYEDEFLIIDYQAPGKATLIEIDQEFNEAFIEKTKFGLIAVLNDLHKGRHVDIIWSWLIDVSAVIVIIFSMAGFILLFPNKRRFTKVVKYTSVSMLILIVGYWLGS